MLVDFMDCMDDMDDMDVLRWRGSCRFLNLCRRRCGAAKDMGV